MRLKRTRGAKRNQGPLPKNERKVTGKGVTGGSPVEKRNTEGKRGDQVKDREAKGKKRWWPIRGKIEKEPTIREGGEGKTATKKKKGELPHQKKTKKKIKLFAKEENTRQKFGLNLKSKREKDPTPMVEMGKMGGRTTGEGGNEKRKKEITEEFKDR